MGVGGQHHAPAALPPGKTRYPLYRRLGGPQGRSGRVRKISPPPGFDPRTVQPVASRYTDWAIPVATILPWYSVCCLESGFPLRKDLKSAPVSSTNGTGFKESTWNGDALEEGWRWTQAQKCRKFLSRLSLLRCGLSCILKNIAALINQLQWTLPCPLAPPSLCSLVYLKKPVFSP